MTALTVEQQDLLTWFGELAAARRPAPTGKEIVAKLELSGESRASLLVSSLEEAGAIFVERGASWRVITITSSGTELRSALAPPADRLPSTIGRPSLGPGEKRKPAETATGSVRIGPDPDRVPLDRALTDRPEPPRAPPPAPARTPSVVTPPPPPAPIARPPAVHIVEGPVTAAALEHLGETVILHPAGVEDPATTPEPVMDQPEPTADAASDWPDAPGPTPAHGCANTSNYPVLARRALMVIERNGIRDTDALEIIIGLVESAGIEDAQCALDRDEILF